MTRTRTSPPATGSPDPATAAGAAGLPGPSTAGAAGSGAGTTAVGRLVAVCVSERRGTVKRAVPQGRLVRGRGLEGDAHAGAGHRQVSLLALESIERLGRARQTDLGPGVFAENLTIAGVDLASLPVGTRLRVGERALLRITQIGKRCHRGCEVARRIGDCVMPREGIFARVLRGGLVRPGDRLLVLPPEGGGGEPGTAG